MRARAIPAFFAAVLLLLALAGARRVVTSREAPTGDIPANPSTASTPASDPGEFVQEGIPLASRQTRQGVSRDGLDEPVEIPHCESATAVGLKAMLHAQNADGSWGGEAEFFEGRTQTQATATSLSILALLSAGYTHLTKVTTSDGLCFGTSVKNGLKWLLKCEPVDAHESALVALALSESYGLTNSLLLKQPARDSLDRLAGWQRFDAARYDPVAEAWAAESVASARLGELDYDAHAADRARARLSERLDSSPDAASAAAWILLTKDRSHPGLAAAATSIAASLPDWEHPDFTGWYFGTLALHQLEGPGREGGPGANWKAWSEALKDALIRHQERDGSWPGVSGPTGNAVRNALGALALEVFYRYASAFGVK